MKIIKLESLQSGEELFIASECKLSTNLTLVSGISYLSLPLCLYVLTLSTAD